MQSKWIRLGWFLLVLPIWWAFSQIDVETGWFSVVGYALFGMAVWIWFRMEDRPEDKNMD